MCIYIKSGLRSQDPDKKQINTLKLGVIQENLIKGLYFESGQDFKKPTTKDSTVCDGGESFPPSGCKARGFYGEAVFGRGTTSARVTPALGGYQVFGCLLLWTIITYCAHSFVGH